MGKRTPFLGLGGESASPGPAYNTIPIDGAFVNALKSRKRPKHVSDFSGRAVEFKNGLSSYPGPGEYHLPPAIPFHDPEKKLKPGFSFGLRTEAGSTFRKPFRGGADNQYFPDSEHNSKVRSFPSNVIH